VPTIESIPAAVLSLKRTKEANRKRCYKEHRYAKLALHLFYRAIKLGTKSYFDRFQMGLQFGKLIGIDVAIQFIGWLISAKFRTEKFFDLTGTKPETGLSYLNDR
jgi:hypothetical protein